MKVADYGEIGPHDQLITHDSLIVLAAFRLSNLYPCVNNA